jgi:hypothetical protein
MKIQFFYVFFLEDANLGCSVAMIIIIVFLSMVSMDII